MFSRPDSGQPPMRQGRTSGDRPIADGVARNLGELARRMQAEVDQESLLQLIADAAVQEVDGADHAGISLLSAHAVRSVARTSEVVPQLDDIQRKMDNGPGLSSLRDQVTVRCDDLRDEPRWPRFATAAVELGVLSMLSVQLFVEGDNLGALTLYAERPHEFSDADESTAVLLAAHAAVAMVGEQKVRNLQIALDSRDLIGQAKGILMERFKLDATKAFAMLVAISQQSHRKLNVVAEQLATTGELPAISA